MRVRLSPPAFSVFSVNKMRLVLFDIDYTLLVNPKSWVGQEYAIKKIFGLEVKIPRDVYEGLTHPMILRAELAKRGVPETEFKKHERELYAANTRLLKSFKIDWKKQILPGVSELLDALSKNGAVLLGVLTGNPREVANVKLGGAGIAHYFKIWVNGPEARDRNGLPPVAIKKATKLLGRPPDSVVIVGDSIHDMRCAKENGLLALGVASGKTTSEELRAAGADAVLKDFSDTRVALEAILSV